MPAHSVGQSGVPEKKEPLREGRQETHMPHLTCILHVFVIGQTGIKDYFVAFILQHECALGQLTDTKGPLMAHPGQEQQACPPEWSPGRLGGAESE